MREEELRRHSKCSLCGKGVAKSGIPLFSVVMFQRYGLDLNAIRRRDGLAAYMGHSGLASAMGPNEDLAKPMGPPVKSTVCETCLMKPTLLARLMETDAEDEEEGAS